MNEPDLAEFAKAFIFATILTAIVLVAIVEAAIQSPTVQAFLFALVSYYYMTK